MSVCKSLSKLSLYAWSAPFSLIAFGFYCFRPMWCAVDWSLFLSNSSVFVKDWVCCLEVVGSFLFVKWVLFRVHDWCFCIKKLLRSMSSSEHVLLVVRCWQLWVKKPPLLWIRQKNYILICNCWTHENHAFSRLDQFLSVNDLDIAAARATQPATIR